MRSTEVAAPGSFEKENQLLPSGYRVRDRKHQWPEVKSAVIPTPNELKPR